MSKFWTHARITELRVLWDRGLSYQAIADHMGVSASSVENTRRLHGLPKRKQGRVKGSRNIQAVTQAFSGREISARPPSDIPWPTPQQCMGRRA